MVSKKIDITVLRESCNLIFNFIENELKIKSIEIDKDLYWSLTNEERHNLSEVPTPTHIGNLFDDYDFVQPLVNNPIQAVPLMFEHLTPLLNEIAIKLSNSK
jgi:hypothetical protein